ncbi:transglutaminase family protein [Nakamurella silvestris]|nr:transglutaminase family protein [Nakamurella silvestris]
MTKTYRITHRTTYSYSDQVSASYGRGYLQPRPTPWQRVLEHAVVIDPAAGDMSTSVDAYGNTDTFFHVTTGHTELVVTSLSLVEVDAQGAPPEITEMPWELARPGEDQPEGSEWAEAVEFVLPSPLIDVVEGSREYALKSFTPDRPLVEAIFDLTHRIYTEYIYQFGSTTISTRIPDLLEKKTGVCQDFAHLAVSCLRSIGLAGRYVSGYLATTPPPGKERMIGADATHAWAAVWLPGGYWLAFDPTNDQFADERYTTVAWGRDYADVPPLKGVIFTDAKKSRMKVSVDVAPV